MSKNEYYASQLPSQSPGTFQKADDNILAGRRQVKPRPANLTSALRAATKDLNARFVQYLLEQRNNRQGQMEETWEEALKDYVTYARHLKMHYRRSGGLVLACGSNDCGQSGHGREEDGTATRAVVVVAVVAVVAVVVVVVVVVVVAVVVVVVVVVVVESLVLLGMGRYVEKN